VQINETA